MPSPRVIWNGTPGEVWHNATEKIKYQLICEFKNSCGVCIQYHLAISNWWPIPFHRNCRCRQVPVRPGGAAQPFRDFWQILDELSPGQRREVIGASNYKLLDAGLIKWEDVVTPTRVRDLQEVVALRKLTVNQMTGAGVKTRYAEEAFARVHTPQAELIRETRQRLFTKVQDAGISREQLVKHAQEAIGRKVGISAGPSKSQPLLKAGPAELPPDLIAGLKRFTPKPSVAPKVKSVPVQPVTPPTPKPSWKPGTPIRPDLPIAERIEQATHLEEKRQAVLAIQAEIDEASMANHRAWSDVDEKMKEMRRGDVDAVKGYGQLQKLEAKLKEAGERRDSLKSQVKSRVNEAIKISRLDAQTFEHKDGIGDWSEHTKAGKARLEARQWFSNKLHGSETANVSITWDAEYGIRANCPGMRIKVGEEDGAWVHVHEMGHALEYQVPSIKKASHEFLEHRVGNQKPEQLKKLFPDGPYRDDEFGRDDDFGKTFGKQSAWYVGKDYGGDATEILSKGLEQLHESPIAFARDDPEFFKFVLGILDGSMRKP